MYFYGIIVAAILITSTVLMGMGLNRIREWWERRGERRRAPR